MLLSCRAESYTWQCSSIMAGAVPVRRCRKARAPRASPLAKSRGTTRQRTLRTRMSQTCNVLHPPSHDTACPAVGSRAPGSAAAGPPGCIRAQRPAGSSRPHRSGLWEEGGCRNKGMYLTQPCTKGQGILGTTRPTTPPHVHQPHILWPLACPAAYPAPVLPSCHALLAKETPRPPCPTHATNYTANSHLTIRTCSAKTHHPNPGSRDLTHLPAACWPATGTRRRGRCAPPRTPPRASTRSRWPAAIRTRACARPPRQPPAPQGPGRSPPPSGATGTPEDSQSGKQRRKVRANVQVDAGWPCTNVLGLAAHNAICTGQPHERTCRCPAAAAAIIASSPRATPARDRSTRRLARLPLEAVSRTSWLRRAWLSPRTASGQLQRCAKICIWMVRGVVVERHCGAGVARLSGNSGMGWYD